MHNIKLIRDKKNYFEKKFKDRNLNINLDDLLSLDKKNRELIQKKEKLEQEKKIISKKQDKSQFEKSKKISKELDLYLFIDFDGYEPLRIHCKKLRIKKVDNTM